MGACEEAVSAHVAVLRQDHALDTGGEALAALAVNLAALVDGGEPAVMTASWARELRQTLAALTPKETAGDLDDDSWLAGLPPPLRDN